jgi:hypothetical protein
MGVGLETGSSSGLRCLDSCEHSSGRLWAAVALGAEMLCRFDYLHLSMLL